LDCREQSARSVPNVKNQKKERRARGEGRTGGHCKQESTLFVSHRRRDGCVRHGLHSRRRGTCWSRRRFHRSPSARLPIRGGNVGFAKGRQSHTPTSRTRRRRLKRDFCGDCGTRVFTNQLESFRDTVSVILASSSLSVRMSLLVPLSPLS